MKSMRIAAVLVLFATAPGAAAHATERFIWFGTSTRPTTAAEGIYVARFDDETGAVTEPVLAAEARNPSFLALHPRLPVLYAVSEIAGDAGTPAGGVIAFEIDVRSGALARMNEQPSGGAGPCHVTVDADGTVVLAANYGGGSVICLGLEADGRLKPVVTGTPGGFLQHAWDRAGESGIDRQRQDKPHAHSVDVAPGGSFAMVCDLGLDRVLLHRLDRKRATLEPLPASATLPPGSGPRHLAMHPDGQRAWCVNELALSIGALSYSWRCGLFSKYKTFTMLPADATDRSGWSAAEIAVHPAGTFLYASLRGHDSIAMFRIVGDTSDLELLGVEPARVKTPRHFAIDPTGAFLLAAGQDSDTVAVFTIDGETGRLDFTGRSIAVPSPACVAFARQPAASSSSR